MNNFTTRYDDNCIYRIHKSIGIDEKNLREHSAKGQKTVLKLNHRGITIAALASDILAYNKPLTHAQNGKVQYHYPLHLWEVVEGDPNGIKKIYEDFKWRWPL